MTTASMKKQLQALEAHDRVKRELPWDCKALFDRHLRGSIITRLTGQLEPFRLEVKDQSGLSLEAREFLSLSAVGQARAVDQCKTPSKDRRTKEEIIEEILNKLSGIREDNH